MAGVFNRLGSSTCKPVSGLTPAGKASVSDPYVKGVDNPCGVGVSVGSGVPTVAVDIGSEGERGAPSELQAMMKIPISNREIIFSLNRRIVSPSRSVPARNLMEGWCITLPFIFRRLVVLVDRFPPTLQAGRASARQRT